MRLLSLLEMRGILSPLIVGLTFFNVFLTTQAHVAAWHKGKPILIVRFVVDLTKKTHLCSLTISTRDVLFEWDAARGQ